MNRIFTITEANTLLPFIRESLLKMQSLLSKARTLRREQEMIKAIGRDASGRYLMATDYDLAEESLAAAIGELNRSIHDVQQMGCLIKDIERGLVDFPAIVGGREVFLCWELGEEAIRYYHDVHAGFAGRRALPIE